MNPSGNVSPAQEALEPGAPLPAAMEPRAPSAAAGPSAVPAEESVANADDECSGCRTAADQLQRRGHLPA